MKPIHFFKKIGSITVIRHAETTWNAPRIRIQGQSRNNTICLSEAGRVSVQPKLAKLPLPNIIITSPLLRCTQTLEAWFSCPFKSIPKPIILKDELMEINAGDYEGKWLDELKEDRLWKQWMEQPHLFPGFPNGETLDQFAHRILEIMSRISIKFGNTNQNVCVMTHGIAMRVMKCFIAGEDLSQLWRHQVENLETISLLPSCIEKFQKYKCQKVPGFLNIHFDSQHNI